MYDIKIKSSDQPIQILVLCQYIKSDLQIKLQESDTNSLELPEVTFTTVQTICRFLARKAAKLNLLGNNILQQAEVDHWIDFSNSINSKDSKDFHAAITYLDNILEQLMFLVGQNLTLADIFVWSALRENENFNTLYASKSLPHHVTRYYNYLSSLPYFKTISDKSPTKSQASSSNVRKERKEEGKFIVLPEAEVGKVVVRFPPEASGYLHIGHAKAALLNQYYQQAFQGQLIMRFDDTNPEKENADFEKVILDDVAMLGIKPDRFTFTSNHFEALLKYCDWMISNNKAYADDTDPETMKKEREARIESKNRNNDVATNMRMWEEMKKGTEQGLKTCIRAKLDMQSDNGCLRDPTMYRCKLEHHARTKDKYKAYPTYDFACPIVDSLEGVTHALRTTEYHDRDEQYYWFLHTIGLRRPFIWEYSRLNLQNTVMSKRKLTWFVDEGIVDGWDDPRFPTVRGVMRRGMTIDGLKEFVIAQGSSRAVTMMDWDKIWAFNKKIIDPVAPRYTALQKDEVVLVEVENAVKESKLVPKHPKNESIGTKDTWYAQKVFIDGADAAGLSEQEIVTFINWGNLEIVSINKDSKKKKVPTATLR